MHICVVYSTQTQIFAKFLQEKTAALMIENDIKYNEGRGADSSQIASFEVKYFDESILSKRNRSRMKLVKNETPFLSDMQ